MEKASIGRKKSPSYYTKEISEVTDNSKWRQIFNTVKKDWRLYVLIAPMVIWFLLWAYKPMGGLLIAFKNYDASKGILNSDFIGLANFKTLMFGTYADQFWRAFRNTFIVSLYGLIFGFPVPILLALFMSEIKNRGYLKIMQTFSYLPHFLSEVTITGLILTLVYNGEVNTGVISNALIHLGMISKDTQIIQDASFFKPLYIIAGMWKDSGYSSIVYFAAIIGISPTLYEALKIDGGNKWQEIRYVTIPGMAPTLILMIIIRIGNMLSIGYERIILLYNANTYSTADVLSSFVYRIGLQNGNQSLGASADLFNALIAFALVIGANYISRQVSETSLW